MILKPEILNFQSFITKYMQEAEDDLKFKLNQIQIYPLALAKKYINPPTNLFRAEYSFILFFINGGGLQQIDNEIFEIKKHDILFIREGHINAIKEINPETDGYYIYIDHKLLKELINPNLLKKITFNPKNTLTADKINWLNNCCQLMMNKQELSTNGAEIKINLLKSFLLMVTEDWGETNNNISKPFKILLDFKELLYQNFTKEHNLSFYADNLTISLNYLNRCVKQISGKTPKQLLNEMLINQSKIYLQENNLNISEICYKLSFNDPAYFSRLFKKIVGVSPTQYINGK